MKIAGQDVTLPAGWSRWGRDTLALWIVQQYPDLAGNPAVTAAVDAALDTYYDAVGEGEPPPNRPRPNRFAMPDQGVTIRDADSREVVSAIINNPPSAKL